MVLGGWSKPAELGLGVSSKPQEVELEGWTKTAEVGLRDVFSTYYPGPPTLSVANYLFLYKVKQVDVYGRLSWIVYLIFN